MRCFEAATMVSEKDDDVMVVLLIRCGLFCARTLVGALLSIALLTAGLPTGWALLPVALVAIAAAIALCVQTILTPDPRGEQAD
jgi:hypothetical protein